VTKSASVKTVTQQASTYTLAGTIITVTKVSSPLIPLSSFLHTKITCQRALLKTFTFIFSAFLHSFPFSFLVLIHDLQIGTTTANKPSTVTLVDTISVTTTKRVVTITKGSQTVTQTVTKSVTATA